MDATVSLGSILLEWGASFWLPALAAAVMLLNPFAEHLLKKSALLRASLMKSLATA